MGPRCGVYDVMMLSRWLFGLGLVVAPVIGAMGCGSGGSSGSTSGEAGALGHADAAPADASASDTTTTVGQDGGSDATTATSYCATLSPKPTLCSDFDEPTNPLVPWTVVNANGYSGNPNVGMLTVDTAVSFSPPASAKAATNAAVDGGDAPEALLRDSLGVTGSDVKVAFEVLIPAGTADVQVLNVLFENGDAFNLVVGPGETKVEECMPISGTYGYNCPDYYPGDAGVPTGVWSNVTLEIGVGPPATLTLTVGGQVVVDHTAIASPFINGAVTVTIGLFNPGPAPAKEIHLDNVVVNVTP